LLDHPKREELLGVLVDAGESAWARGAHEVALQSFRSARSLLRDRPWEDDPGRTLLILSRIAALSTWKGDFVESDTLIAECLSRVDQPEHKAQLFRMRSRNQWMQNNFIESLSDILLALRGLGVEIQANPSRKQTDIMFEQVKNEILAVGFDEILLIPKATDPRTDLAVGLLNDAGMYGKPA
jgi:predicted ATPase